MPVPPRPCSLQFNAVAQLPGVQPRLLGVVPAVWVLLSGAPQLPQPAGALLLNVQLPPPGLASEVQAVLLQVGKGLESSLRLAVYNAQDGRLLRCRDRLQRCEYVFHLHPRFRVPAWDSGCVAVQQQLRAGRLGML